MLLGSWSVTTFDLAVTICFLLFQEIRLLQYLDVIYFSIEELT